MGSGCLLLLGGSLGGHDDDRVYCLGEPISLEPLLNVAFLPAYCHHRRSRGPCFTMNRTCKHPGVVVGMGGDIPVGVGGFAVDRGGKLVSYIPVSP